MGKMEKAFRTACYNHLEGGCPLSTISAKREIVGVEAVEILKKRIFETSRKDYYEVRIAPELKITGLC